MHTVIVIAAQQDHRRKSRIETKLKFLSDKVAVLESDETTSYWTVVNTMTHVIIESVDSISRDGLDMPYIYITLQKH